MSPPQTAAPPKSNARRRGRRPDDARARRARVEQAVAELEASQTPFTMADVAERAGISRATLYRDAGLRDLVGARGDGPPVRPVSVREHDNLRAQTDTLRAERRALRRALRAAEKRVADAEARADALEAAQSRRATTPSGPVAERLRADAYAEGFAAGAKAANRGGRTGSGANTGLLAAAVRLPRPALLAARRTLARALHPDLFTQAPAASLLATELLKQLNALAGPER